MSRFFRKALIWTLLTALCVPAAMADALVVEALDAETVEALDAEIAEADSAGDTGLIIDGAEGDIEWEADDSEDVALLGQPTGAEIDSDGTAANGEQIVDAAAEGEQIVDAAEIPTGPATGIQLSESTIVIGVKESYSGLAVSALPKGSAMPEVSWRSKNARVAKVDASGKITGVKKGTTTVYAKMKGGKEVACTVKVRRAPKRLTVKPSKLKLSASGMTRQLKYKLPKGCASKQVTFTSDNTKVATVDANGVITTVGAGKATIRVKAFNGKGGKCTVTVTAAPASIAFPVDALSIAVGQKTKLAPVVTLTNKKTGTVPVTYSISARSKDAGCVSLNAETGALTGVRKGSAVIVATTYNGKTATLTVTVAAAPTGIRMNQASAVIGVKDVYSGLLPELTLPIGEKNCATTLTWTSSNRKVATVDANGIVTGLKRGTAKITATTVNGLKATCKVTVRKAPKKISLKPASASLLVGETTTFKVCFTKKSGGTVRFDTSNHSIATIDEDGLVHALKEGTVTITATAYNNVKATAKLKVSKDVSLPPDDISPVTEYDDSLTNAQKLEYMIYIARQQLGKPYIYGNGYNKINPRGFDCSGLVYWCFRHIKVTLKATAHKQGYDTRYQKITDIRLLRRGDTVHFNTVEDGDDDLSDHSGIYLGDGKFIHASSSAGKVVISSLTSGYYHRNFYCGRRILP